ncbi:NFAT activation molecule 1 [Symphorus nematophorus]
MEAQQFWHLSFISSWTVVFFFPCVCSGIETPNLSLESRVFVALAGDDLKINCELKVPANQSKDTLVCFSPFAKQIYNSNISATADLPQTLKLTLELKKMMKSGEYTCQYKTAKVYWFLRVRHDGYEDLPLYDDTEIIIVTIFTGVLLVFSVVGSVYVFRGHWKVCNTESGDSGRTRKQNRGERKERGAEEDQVAAITAPSTSFYASLEPRPRSIYDVLDHSAANTKPDQSKAKPKKKKKPSNTMGQTTQPQQEDVFESVYENF